MMVNIDYAKSVKEVGDKMNDLFLFLHQGWKNSWKHPIIWLFSALPIAVQLVHAAWVRPESNAVRSPLFIIEGLISLAVSFVSYVGVLYLAYCFSIDRSASLRETLFAVRKFSGRILGFMCLSLIVIVPCFLFAVAPSTRNATQVSSISRALTIWLLPLAIVSLLAQLVVAGFFAKDRNIRQSIQEAWLLFIHHVGVLVILAVILQVLFRVYYMISGILTVLIQSGFDSAFLNNLNYLDPSTTLSGSIWFVLIAGVGQLLFAPLSASVFILAYLKYSNLKIA